MTEQYLRVVQLIVGNAGGQAIDLSNLRIQFSVRNTTIETLKSADIHIYNVSPETAAQVMNEFTDVELHAGYGDNVGMIFRGQIGQVKWGKRNATDTLLEIYAQDLDAAYNQAYINTSLAKGWTPDDLYGAMLKALAPYGVTQGYKPQFIGNPAIRGNACYGMVRDYMRSFADQHGCEWSMENGQLNLIPKASYMPGPVPVIRPDTGLIGTPRQTIQGIEIQCLLNPLVKAGGQVQLDNSNLQTLTNSPGFQRTDLPAGLDPTGFYKCYQVIHEGDTRGEAFFTFIIGAAVDGTAPINSSLYRQVPDGQ